MIHRFNGTLLPIIRLALIGYPVESVTPQEKLDGHVLQHAIR